MDRVKNNSFATGCWRSSETASTSRPEIWSRQSNSRIYACPQVWKMAAAPPASASAFQGGKREDKGQIHVPAKSHTSLRFVCHAKLIAQLTQPLFLIFSLQISTCLAPSLDSNLHLDIASSQRRPSLAALSKIGPLSFTPQLCAVLSNTGATHYPFVLVEHLKCSESK